MAFLVDQLRFLGLSDKEVRVFTALSTFGQMNVSKTAKRAGLPRTTVDYILKGLAEQGLIARERVGGHYEYVVKSEEVANKLDWIEQRLRPKTCPGEEAQQSPFDEDTDIAQTLPGAEEVPTDHPVMKAPEATQQPSTADAVILTHEDTHRAIEQAFTTRAGDRVVMLLSALTTPEKRLERFEHCLTYAKETGARLEVLTTTDVADELSRYAQRLLRKLSAYDLRLNFLPPSFCLEYTDVLAFRDAVFVINHNGEVTERVEAEHTVSAINHLLMVAREAGWGMDIKLWLEGVLKSKR